MKVVGWLNPKKKYVAEYRELRITAETDEEREFLERLQEEFTDANMHDIASMFDYGKVTISVMKVE